MVSPIRVVLMYDYFPIVVGASLCAPENAIYHSRTQGRFVNRPCVRLLGTRDQYILSNTQKRNLSPTANHDANWFYLQLLTPLTPPFLTFQFPKGDMGGIGFHIP